MSNRLVLAGLLMLLYLHAPCSPSFAASDARSTATLEEVLVTGEHPGPGLWKVSNGERTLWILGTHAPLPQRLFWRSQEVELVITEAQEVIGNYSASFTLSGANPFTAKGAALRQILPRKTYARWRTLKERYLGRNREVENALPVSAALQLRSAAFEAAGLISADNVWREIYTLAKRYNVPVTTRHQINHVVDAGAMDDKKSRQVGVDYLINTIENLEGDLRAARTRANAWAVGDIDVLRQQAAADKNAADLYATSWPFLQGDELRRLIVQADRNWIAAADRALQKNQTTFAALPIFLLLRHDGLLTALRAKGYSVEEPLL